MYRVPERETIAVSNDRPTADELLESALAYAKRGWPVLPLHTPQDRECSCSGQCNKVGKHPRWHKLLIPNGYKNATCDQDRIIQWWHIWPDANIGIVTGTASGLVVLDIDLRHHGDATVAELQKQHSELPKSLRVCTGDGWHLYLKHPGGKVKSIPIARGVDLKADGGYVVAPPSLHASGKIYTWENE